MTAHHCASLPLLAASTSNAALVTFLIYTLAVFGLAWLSNRLLQSKSFLSEYFLGSRNLGVWAFALTFAATSASGGSFTGFPSKIYTHGWAPASAVPVRRSCPGNRLPPTGSSRPRRPTRIRQHDSAWCFPLRGGPRESS